MRKYFTFFILLWTIQSTAQEAMRVVRCEAVDRQLSIQNIYINEENKKWAGHENGVVEVLDLSLGRPIEVPEGNISLLSIPGGNADLTFSKADLEKAIGVQLTEDNTITCANYRTLRNELWIGTFESGAFRLKVDGTSLRLLDSYNSKNSKLKSDQINTIYVDPFGRTWMGTNDGVFFGKDNKWSLAERYFNFTQIDLDSTNRIWLMADDLIGYMNRKQVWNPVDLPEAALDGPIIDFTFDVNGFLWVVTEVVARIDLNNEDFDVYGPADYYTSQFATTIASDFDGSVWVGTEDKGLYLIESASAMTVNALVEKGLDCETGGNTGELSVRVTGGLEPYEYQWEGGLAGANPKNLGKGTYVVTVTDSRGNQKIAKAEITDPNVIAEATFISQESDLNQKDGKAKVEVLQGQAPFTYAWDNGERTEMAIQLGEGEHTITVTDNNGCSTVAKVGMTRIIGELNSAIAQEADIKCFGEKTAILNTTVAGGKGPYQYQWNTGATTPNLENVGAGDYSLTITDSQSNQTLASIQVTEPGEFTLEMEVVSPPSTGANDGIATAITTGGKGPYLYRWSTSSIRDTIQGLAPGPISVTVTDASGCSASAETTLDENILPLSAELVFTQTIQCKGQPQANFKIQAKGGKKPYQYKWSQATVTGDVGSNQLAGAYEVTITDVSGQEFVKSFTIEEPDLLKISASITSPASTDQADGEAKLAASGGVKPYQYRWSNGYNQSIGKGLAPGNYDVTVVDANGCEASTIFAMDENILPLTSEITIEQAIDCGGAETGALTVNPQGGKGPFEIQWKNGSNTSTVYNLAQGYHSVTITDALGARTTNRFELTAPPNLVGVTKDLEEASTDQTDGKASLDVEGGFAPYSITWASGEKGENATRLAPGNQKVVITDSIGCQTEVEFDLGENVLPITASLKIEKPVTCNGDQDGIVAVDLQGGKSPFEYEWESLETKTEKGTNLKAGLYTVTITDAIGQTSTASIELPNPDTLKATITKVFPSSNQQQPNGYGYVEVTGGVQPYAFEWDNGETTQAAERLSLGVHRVAVIDSNGCRTEDNLSIEQRLIAGLSMTNIEIGKRISLEEIEFDADSTVLKPEYHVILDELYDFLVYNPKVNIEIGGHTNSLPPDEYCDPLSRARAKSVADYLIKERGIDVFRVFYKGYGKRDPIATNETEEGRKKNQRVELKVISIR